MRGNGMRELLVKGVVAVAARRCRSIGGLLGAPQSVVSASMGAANDTATKVFAPQATNHLTWGVWQQRGGVQDDNGGDHELFMVPEHHESGLHNRKFGDLWSGAASAMPREPNIR